MIKQENPFVEVKLKRQSHDVIPFLPEKMYEFSGAVFNKDDVSVYQMVGAFLLE